MSHIEMRERPSSGGGLVHRLGRILGNDLMPPVILLGATALALAWANSPGSGLYGRIFATPLTVGVGEVAVTKPLLLWINDGLMAVFFLYVGLELKRELLVGKLAGYKQAALPIFAAIGGMAVPALFYLVFNQGGSGARGWGIPMATDIAFALGVLALLGSRAPIALKVFVTAVAVVDDMGAVAVIALFYTDQVALGALGAAGLLLLGLVGLNRAGVRGLAPYLLGGAALWVAVLQSGVHATVAGVALAMTIPMAGRDGSRPLITLEHALAPWVLLAVVPIFALANAGVALGGAGGPSLGGPVVLGIVAGLVLGKPLGVLGMAWLAMRLGWAERPADVTWTHLAAAGMLTGIGFTMSLFIGQLAFGPGPLLESAKLGVLAASALSAVGAGAVLVLARGGAEEERPRLRREEVPSEEVPRAA